MHIEWDVELRHFGPKGSALWFIQILNLVGTSDVGKSIDQDADKPELLDATLSLSGGGFRVLHSNTAKRPEAFGVRSCCVELADFVIDLASRLDSNSRIKYPLDTGHGQLECNVLRRAWVVVEHQADYEEEPAIRDRHWDYRPQAPGFLAKGEPNPFPPDKRQCRDKQARSALQEQRRRAE